MFTGIIESVGAIKAMQVIQSDMRIHINVAGLVMSDVNLGDSIAVNGVCLTVIEHDDHSFKADVSLETINKTSLADWQVGHPVNLEKALTLSTRLGGHIVSGHVDTIGRIASIVEDARSIQYQLQVEKKYLRYAAVKGSITVDGVSLTINAIDNDLIMLNIVPHTQASTTFKHYQVGSTVNVEVDVIARYLEQLHKPEYQDENQQQGAASKLTESLLKEHGFIQP